MLKRFTYRQRLKYLPVGFVLALLLIYWLAIRETVKIKNDCSELIKQTKTAEDAPQQMRLIKTRLDELNNVMGSDTVKSDADPLLKFVSRLNSNNSNLVDFQPLHVFEHQNYQVETRIAVFEGTYVNLVKFLFDLEQKFLAGKVVSVKFQTETNFKTERKRLLMTLYVQSVKNVALNNDEASSPLKK